MTLKTVLMTVLVLVVMHLVLQFWGIEDPITLGILNIIVGGLLIVLFGGNDE